jgi:hypothetical protein
VALAMPVSQRKRAVLIALGSLLAAFGLWLPAFYSLQATGFGDWQFFHHMWEAGYVALSRYGEWPLWDPYHCGGITILGNPQSQHLSPLYLIALLAGPTLGSKLFLVMHAWAGFAGMYLFARREHGLGLPGALLASLGWAASGFFASHGSGGHSAFLPFYLAPWLLLAWRAAAHELRYCAAVAGLLALVLLEGGVYPFPYLVLLLCFDALLRFIERAPVRGIAGAALLAAPLTGLLGAIRLLPIMDELARNPRTMPSTDGVYLDEVLEMLTARDHGWRYEGHEFVWPEYGTYVGWAVLGLGALGLFGAWRRPWRGVVAGLVLFLAFMTGEHGPASPWSLVHRLPVYDSLRVPSRFAVFFTLYLGLLAGHGLDLVAQKLARVPRPLAPVLRALPFLAVGGIAADLVIVHFPVINRWTDPPVVTNFVSERHYLTERHAYGRFYASFPRMNLGSRGCYEAMTFTPARGLWTGDRPQARLLRTAGSVRAWGRTSSRVWADVTLEQSGRVLFNQNYAPGWRSSAGTVVSNAEMLAVDLPKGSYHLALRYRPRTLLPGACLSALGTLCALALWFSKRGRRAMAPVREPAA